MFCMKCGQKLPDEAKFCFNCGTVVTPVRYVEPSAAAPEPEQDEHPLSSETPFAPYESEQPYAQLPPTDETPKRKLPRWAIFAGGGVLVVLLALCVFFFVRSKNNSGEEPESPAAAEVVAPATEEPAAAAQDDVQYDMELPVPGEDESLYVGKMHFDEAESSEIAFILSADGTEIHDITIYQKNLSLDLNASTSISSMTITETYKATFDRMNLPFSLALRPSRGWRSRRTTQPRCSTTSMFTEAWAPVRPKPNIPSAA
jgi:hypothetical protein